MRDPQTVVTDHRSLRLTELRYQEGRRREIMDDEPDTASERAMRELQTRALAEAHTGIDWSDDEW